MTKPKFRVGQLVNGPTLKKPSPIIKVWETSPGKYRYTIKGTKTKVNLDEDEISGA